MGIYVLLALCLLIVFALWLKGDVKAMFKLPLLAFSLETKDKRRPARRGPRASARGRTQLPVVETRKPPELPP